MYLNLTLMDEDCLPLDSYADFLSFPLGYGITVATGCSVTKTPSGGEEIVLQGDASDDIFDWVVDVANVPDSNVECIEDKKKKSGGGSGG